MNVDNPFLLETVEFVSAVFEAFRGSLTSKNERGTLVNLFNLKLTGSRRFELPEKRRSSSQNRTTSVSGALL